ncbi:hypothetical protein JN085_14410 [Mycolicibacterium austroafricanum]|nr:hypothetical protein JN085_14410 [Mycolicibacterium austroafricanum]
MTDHELTPTDAAVRQRLTELSVHIPCGGIRGPVRRTTSHSPRLWQSCRCEDRPERWEGVDVSRDTDLCIVCFRGTAGGVSRWSWLACEDCRAVNSAIGQRWGVRPFHLGRHSLMNGIGVRSGAPPEVRNEQLAQLQEFVRGDIRLRDWRRIEYPRLAACFDPLADVPLRTWQEEHPPSRNASWDALTRLVTAYGAG